MEAVNDLKFLPLEDHFLGVGLLLIGKYFGEGEDLICYLPWTSLSNGPLMVNKGKA